MSFADFCRWGHDRIIVSKSIYVCCGSSANNTWSCLLDTLAYLGSRTEWASYISAFFDGKHYYEANPDVAEAELEPISHYLRYGWRELRSPSRYFDSEGFCRAHPELEKGEFDLAQSCVQLYGSYAWIVDGALAPKEVSGRCLSPFLSLAQRRQIFRRWQKYRYHFHADYYQAEYPDACSTAGEAFAHYMNRGFTEDRNPRPDFDGYKYRKKFGLLRSQNPFRHFIDHLADVEPLHAFKGYTSNRDEIAPTKHGEALSDDVFQRVQLCIHFHCYYVDLLHEVLDRLRHIKVRFSLVVTVCSEPDGDAVRQNLSDILYGRDVNVLVVKNRGRDIGPFLIESSEIWRKSDVVLHLHTKKSPHVSWGDGWRKYLFQQTIGNEVVLANIISMFMSNPGIGLLYPENYSMIRHFTEREENMASICGVAEKLGIKLDASRLNTYPAGSMAFYRTSTLVDIIDNDQLEGLFGEEQGELDGTAAHALERLLPEHVRQLGFVAKSYRAAVPTRAK